MFCFILKAYKGELFATKILPARLQEVAVLDKKVIISDTYTTKATPKDSFRLHIVE
jgi:hypothetical protein